MPFICLTQDLPDGIVNILDLAPNTSLRNLIIDAPGQTRYLNRVVVDNLVQFSTTTGFIGRELDGLGAYIVDRVDAGGLTTWDTANLTAVTDAIIARMDGGLELTEAEVNAILGPVTTGSSLSGGNSTGDLGELLSILSGRVYRIPEGAAIATVGPLAWNPAQVGSFTEDVLTFDADLNDSPNGTQVPREIKPIRTTYDSGALQESVLLGQLARFANGVTLFNDSDVLPPISGQQPQIDNARLVVVYNDDGTVLA